MPISASRQYSRLHECIAPHCCRATWLASPSTATARHGLQLRLLHSYPPIPNTYSKDLQQMVRDCLDPLPEKRPTMDRILGLPAINSRLHLLERGAIHPPSTAQSNLIETIKVGSKKEAPVLAVTLPGPGLRPRQAWQSMTGCISASCCALCPGGPGSVVDPT
jgi:hypothetical protein